VYPGTDEQPVLEALPVPAGEVQAQKVVLQGSEATEKFLLLALCTSVA